MLSKGRIAQLTQTTAAIIRDDFFDRTIIPAQVLYDRAAARRKSFKFSKPDYYSVLRDNFEAVMKNGILCVKAHYQPTEAEPIPEPWIRKIIKENEKRPFSKQENDIYILYLNAATAAGAKRKSRTFLYEKLNKYGIKIKTENA